MVATGDISASMDRTLLEQSRRNELRIATARAAALVLTSAVNAAAYLTPSEELAPPPARNFVITTVFAVGAVGVAIVLRRRYRPWVRLVMPFADAALVAVLFATTTQRFDADYLLRTGVVVNVVAATALLAASGGLRLSRGAALLTTVLAVAIFVAVGLLAGFGPLRLAFPTSLLIGVGLLGMWMTDVVRASIRSEVARSILERFVPPSVVERVHDDPLALITVPRSLDATIVVTDLRGFTTLSEKEPPPVVLEFLNRVQGTLADIVHRHGGTIDKFMGDGMLAVFGAPEPQPDHADRALAATLEMVVAVNGIDLEGGARVRLGAGVHSGEVVAGCLGSGTKLEFTVIGDTVNATSRLESMTKDKGVSALISEETRRRLAREAPAALQPMGEVQIRGRAQSLVVHAFEDEGPARSVFPDSLR